MRSDSNEYFNRNKGKRPFFADLLRLPNGWVISMDVPYDFWYLCNSTVYPMDVKGLLKPKARYVRWAMATNLDLPVKKVVFVVVYDPSVGYWPYNFGPIPIDMLHLQESTLLFMYSDARKQKQYTLAEAIRRTVLFLTGNFQPEKI